MRIREFETFLESLRTTNNSMLVDTIIEGFLISHKEQYQMEGIGDTYRDIKNKAKMIGATGKEVLFGVSEEQTFKNQISRTILNKKLYDSNSRRGQDAIKKIVNLITHGTHDQSLPNNIAQLADDVLIDCIENALASNPNVKVKILKPNELRNKMDVVFDEIASSVIKPLEKLGNMRLNDDRIKFVTEWWDKNVVSKMGKYFDAIKSVELKIEPKAHPQPKKPRSRKTPNVTNSQPSDFSLDVAEINKKQANRNKTVPMPPRPEE